jgi:hypothetical protein
MAKELCLRPRVRGRLFRRRLLARGDGAADLLPPGRARVRARGAEAAGMVGQEAARTARGMSPGRFRHFAAIDWSGAVGERHRGIAVAMCSDDGQAPSLIRPGHRWSRPEVLDWLLNDLSAETLVGFDMGISLAHADAAAFFPEWADSPQDARSLWALIEQFCETDPHLSVSSFVDHPEVARHFRRHGGREGDLFGGGRGRFRVTELAQQAMGCKPYSNFNLVGAAQVGKSSLSGMRLLHRLNGRAAGLADRSFARKRIGRDRNLHHYCRHGRWAQCRQLEGARLSVSQHITRRAWLCRDSRRRPDCGPRQRRPDHRRMAPHRSPRPGFVEPRWPHSRNCRNRGVDLRRPIVLRTPAHKATLPA